MAQRERAKRKAERRRAFLTREVRGLLAERDALLAKIESWPSRSRLIRGTILDLRWCEQFIADLRMRHAKLAAAFPESSRRHAVVDDDEAA